MSSKSFYAAGVFFACIQSDVVQTLLVKFDIV
jgi:hypothetical protein